MKESSLGKSHIIQEDQKFVKFNQKGETQLISERGIQSGYSYRKVHYTHQDQWKQGVFSKELFKDPEYQINQNQLSRLDPNNGRIVLKRLYDLYRHFPKSAKPCFFPKQEQVFSRKVKDHSSLPPYVTQIDVFPVRHYKSLFITQDFAETGLYEIIINQNGRFQTDVVDDVIPVYEDSLQPIWNMSLQQAWKVILLKFWAKKNGSYERVKDRNAFEFLEFFTNSNWKYFNLAYGGYDFLNYYTDKIQRGKFVLKTKNTQKVHQAGLIPNCAGYQILDIRQQNKSSKDKHKKWFLLIRSTLINKWAGSMSVLDRKVNDIYDSKKKTMCLQRDFMISDQDFLNLFSSAYVASRRENSLYFSDYHIMSIPARTKNAVFLQFYFQKAGFFDFCIKQFSENRVQTKQSRYKNQNADNSPRNSKYSNASRFLKCKFALIKVHQSQRVTQDDYLPMKYQAYDIQYSHGYNRGDARFINIEPGLYLLRIKLQQFDQIANLVVNYTSQERLRMKQVELTKSESSLLIRQAMASFMERVGRYSLNTKQLFEQISYVQKFQELGYGFVAVRAKKKCPYSLLIEVDPIECEKQGFKLKYPFKNIKQVFSVLVKPGQSTSVVIKKNKQKYTWPPKSIRIFQQKKR